MNIRFAFVCCAAFCVAANIGCQQRQDLPELGQVTGTVTLDGKPVIDAEIQFSPDNAVTSQGTTDDQGKYSLRYRGNLIGAVVGTHTIRIMKAEGMALTEVIPPEFNRHSTLRREVKPGENVIDFDLQSDPPENTRDEAASTAAPVAESEQ